MKARTLRLFAVLVTFACLVAACEMFLPLDESSATTDKNDGAQTDGAISDGALQTDGSVGPDGQSGNDAGQVSEDASFDANSSLYDGNGSTSYCEVGTVNDVFCVDFDESDDAGAQWKTTSGVITLATDASASPPGAGRAFAPMASATASIFTSPVFSKSGAKKVTLAFALRTDVDLFPMPDHWVFVTLHVGIETFTLEWKANDLGYYHPSFINGGYNLSPAGSWHEGAIIVTPTNATVAFDHAQGFADGVTNKAITVDNANVSVTLGVTGVSTNTHDGEVSIDNVRLTIE